jgi:methionine synthase I (cobalamin-dependent)
MLLTGDVSPDTLLHAFTEQAQALAEGGVDALVIETMSDPEEARIAITAAKTTSLPIVACMVFDAGKNKDRTMMGTTPEQAASILTEAGADAIGSNCGQGIANFIPLAQRLKAATHLPIWIKANAGLPELIDGQVTYNTTPQQFASHYSTLQQTGAAFIGGCCGTNPLFIQALLQARQSSNPKPDP